MSRNHNYYVYIMASINRVTYIGVTNDLLRRVMQHRSDHFEGFSHKYKTKKLVYYEYFTDIRGAIAREKELKKWRREKKVQLIEKENQHWRDVFEDIIIFSKKRPDIFI